MFGLLKLFRVAVVGAVCVAGVVGGGCARAVQVENPIEIGAEEYHPVFEASVEVLREHRFRVDRRDRRFGVVTSGPLLAASAFEPWHDDNTTAYQVAESTLNHQRRRVRIDIEPLETADADAEMEADADAGPPEVYTLLVQVFIERRQHPPRELNSGIFTGVDLRRRPRIHEPLVTEEGVIESRWRLVRRDPELEQRLIRAIIRRSFEIDPSYEPPTPVSDAAPVR